MKRGGKKNGPVRPGFKPKHSLGQNFLTDAALLEELIEETGVGPEDHVLEIGPGAGDMTRLLSLRCRTLTAVEIDRDLIPILRVVMDQADNFTLVEGDILRTDLNRIMEGRTPYRVVANIPYYLTTDLMNLLLRGDLPITGICVMLQKEAAERILASPGTSEYGPLAVRARYFTDPRLARIVDRTCFTPPPKVDSAFLCMPWRDAPLVEVRDEKQFFRIVRAAFALRRKTLRNNLISTFRLPRAAAEDWICRARLPGDIRGEAMTIRQFADLANAESGEIQI